MTSAIVVRLADFIRAFMSNLRLAVDLKRNLLLHDAQDSLEADDYKEF